MRAQAIMTDGAKPHDLAPLCISDGVPQGSYYTKFIPCWYFIVSPRMLSKQAMHLLMRLAFPVSEWSKKICILSKLIWLSLVRSRNKNYTVKIRKWLMMFGLEIKVSRLDIGKKWWCRVSTWIWKTHLLTFIKPSSFFFTLENNVCSFTLHVHQIK